VELLAGDPVAAERSLRRGYAALEEMGDRALLSTTAAFLGQALLAQGRLSEAESLAELSAELAAADDVLTQILWRGVRVRSLVGHGRPSEAERLARDALGLVERTDLVNETGNALTDLAMVLRATGQEDEARREFGEALRLYEKKGNAVAAERVQSHLAATAQL
jgi:tetratricopeptide (TPR) repeat protein